MYMTFECNKYKPLYNKSMRFNFLNYNSFQVSEAMHSDFAETQRSSTDYIHSGKLDLIN